MRRGLTTLLCAAAAGLAAGPALAHDTWFSPLPPTPRGQLVLALGTGEAFPRYQVAIAPAQLADSGCVGDGVRERPLRDGVELSLDGLRQAIGAIGAAPPVLALRTGRPVSPAVSVSCWARLQAIDITIDDPTVDLYLDEVQALSAVRARWAALKARGVRWQERYVKHARIEIDGDGDTAAVATVALPGQGLDLQMVGERRPLRAGDTVHFQLLRDGQPLAGQPLQAVADALPAGLWRSTDDQGRLRLALPVAGRWLLRGTAIAPAADGSERWDSLFVTLAFEVRP